jgi:hypothetical protein
MALRLNFRKVGGWRAAIAIIEVDVSAIETIRYIRKRTDGYGGEYTFCHIVKQNDGGWIAYQKPNIDGVEHI